MGSITVAGLLFATFIAFKLPTAVCDCYTNNDFSNCATCYQTFANALVDTEDNKYNLSRAFFPVENAASVQVEVTYISSNSSNTSLTCRWIKGGFYAIQPLNVFLYRSLFFSPPTWRKESVTVLLPDECFKIKNNTFFVYASQRVSNNILSTIHI